MKTTIAISKNDLLSKLKLVAKITQSGKINPVTEQILMVAEKNTLSLTCTDMSGAITTTMECECFEYAEFCIDAKIMIDALSELSEQPITITIETAKVDVTYQNGSFSVASFDVNLFPKFKQDDDIKTITIEKSTLNDGIHSVSMCIANNELRPVMNGVFMKATKNKISFVATDAETLALREFDFENDGDVLSVIIPSKASKLITSLLPICSDKIEITVSYRNISFSSNGNQFIYRLVEGRYPNYQAVIPDKNNKHIIINKAESIGALRRSAVFANQASQMVIISTHNNGLTIQGQDIDFGHSSEETISANYDGEPIRIGFKSTKLISLISAIESDEYTLQLSEPNRAAIIKSDIKDFILLIMPMLINT